MADNLSNVVQAAVLSERVRCVKIIRDAIAGYEEREDMLNNEWWWIDELKRLADAIELHAALQARAG